MDEINCNKDAEWRRLRKQVNAYKQRINKRSRDHTNKDSLRQKDRYIRGTLSIVEDMVQPEFFQEIIRRCREQFPTMAGIEEAPKQSASK